MMRFCRGGYVGRSCRAMFVSLCISTRTPSSATVVEVVGHVVQKLVLHTIPAPTTTPQRPPPPRILIVVPAFS